MAPEIRVLSERAPHIQSGSSSHTLSLSHPTKHAMLDKTILNTLAEYTQQMTRSVELRLYAGSHSKRAELCKCSKTSPRCPPK